MLLKRHFENGKLSHVEIRHTGVKPEQNFSEQLVAQGIADGWMSLVQGHLVLHGAHMQTNGTLDGLDLVYDIKRGPGFYCCHCGEKLAGGNEIARAHLEDKHKGVASPDPANPAGYQKLNHYEVVLKSDLHERFKARAGGRPEQIAGDAVAAKARRGTLQTMIVRRNAARAAGNSEEAGRIEGELLKRNIVLKDLPDGTTIWGAAPAQSAQAKSGS